MEYGKRIDWTRSTNPGYMKYIGWDAIMQIDNIRELWSEEHLLTIQKIVAEKSRQYHPENRPILVSLDNIGSVLFQCYQSNNPNVGDIYSRFIMDNTELQRQDITQIIQRTINVILHHINALYTTRQCNEKLTIWNSLYGDFNNVGLRSHSNIKIRKNKIPFQFHMRY